MISTLQVFCFNRKKSLHVLSPLEPQCENSERTVQTEVALEVGMNNRTNSKTLTADCLCLKELL